VVERLDRAWFAQATFPHSWECTTRFADLDPLGDINNVAMAPIPEDLVRELHKFMIHSGGAQHYFRTKRWLDRCGA
jgi:acyl-CoA thioesterase FadM